MKNDASKEYISYQILVFNFRFHYASSKKSYISRGLDFTNFAKKAKKAKICPRKYSLN